MYGHTRIPANKGVVFEIEGKYYSPRLRKVIPYWLAVPERAQEDNLPVVYFLHGRGGNRLMFRDLGGPGVMERYLNNDGKPFAVVGLMGSFANHDTYWVNAATGSNGLPWATIVLKEMIPWIERRHNLGGSWRRRMIAGISMGSHGALQLAMNSRGDFKCVAGHSLVVRDYESMGREFPGLFGTREQFGRRDPLTLLQGYKERRQVPFQKVWIDIGGKDVPDFIRWASGIETELIRLGYSNQNGSKLDVAREYPNGDHTYVYWTKRLPEYVNWYGSCFNP